jgi:hypothetical protein
MLSTDILRTSMCEWGLSTKMTSQTGTGESAKLIVIARNKYGSLLALTRLIKLR